MNKRTAEKLLEKIIKVDRTIVRLKSKKNYSQKDIDMNEERKRTLIKYLLEKIAD